MNHHEPVETTGHIKRIDILGTDPLTGNIVIELFCGRPQGERLHRAGVFSISSDALRQFLRQADIELTAASAATMRSA